MGRMTGSICVVAAGFLLAGAFSPSARAQAPGMAGIGQTEVVSVRATVKSIDQGTRTVTLVGPQGNTLQMKVSDEVRNLPQVKVGDAVTVRYYASTAYVLAPPGTKLPDDSLTIAGGRAAPGQKPAGALGTRTVVTSTVVGVDPVAHTLQLIDPTGGMVRNVDVVTPQGQQGMKLVKVGDTITAVVSEAVAISVEPGS